MGRERSLELVTEDMRKGIKTRTQEDKTYWKRNCLENYLLQSGRKRNRVLVEKVEDVIFDVNTFNTNVKAVGVGGVELGFVGGDHAMLAGESVEASNLPWAGCIVDQRQSWL